MTQSEWVDWLECVLLEHPEVAYGPGHAFFADRNFHLAGWCLSEVRKAIVARVSADGGLGSTHSLSDLAVAYELLEFYLREG